jgi:hypothetical protein
MMAENVFHDNEETRVRKFSFGYKPQLGWRHLLLIGFFLGLAGTAAAETPAPSVHWGAISYPDRDRTLMAGMTFNRFTEFNGSGARFNNIQQSAGFNFATVTWTERLKALPGWNTNLTVGAGPTQPDPTLYLQNDFVHRLLNVNPVPVGESRNGTDFMISGSVTRWVRMFGDREIGFAGVGFSSGSLYHEVNGQIGVRRLSLAEIAESWAGSSPTVLNIVSRFIRFSAMGRYGRLYGGAAYSDAVIANQSYLAQGSVTLSDYEDNDVDPPRWEIEFAATIDSGLFFTPSGNSIERRFGSIALRFPYGVFESWNDVLGKTDAGPTYGLRFMVDVLRIYDRFSKSS